MEVPPLTESRGEKEELSRSQRGLTKYCASGEWRRELSVEEGLWRVCKNLRLRRKHLGNFLYIIVNSEVESMDLALCGSIDLFRLKF